MVRQIRIVEAGTTAMRESRVRPPRWDRALAWQPIGVRRGQRGAGDATSSTSSTKARPRVSCPSNAGIRTSCPRSPRW